MIVLNERGVPLGQHGQPAVRHAERDELVGGRGQVELELRIAGKDLQPPPEVPLQLDELTEAQPAVGHQEPAPVEVGGEELGYDIRTAPGQDLDEGRLEPGFGEVGLEPDVAPVGGGAHGRGPWPDVRLLDRPRDLDAELPEAAFDPGVGLGEPLTGRPTRHTRDRSRRRHGALTIDERETIIRALEDTPPGLEELRAVLLREHVGRVRDGLVYQHRTGRCSASLAPVLRRAGRSIERTSETGRSFRIRPVSFP